jgi:competence protein ComEA
MRIKRIEQFVKEYFYFSQNERKGIFALIALIIIVVALPSMYEIIIPRKPFNISFKTLEMQSSMTAEHEQDVAQLTSFDPNTATAAQLKALGFTEKNIVTLQKYISKGGNFKQPEDLRKMYGLKPKLVEQLIPLVEIENTQLKNSTKVFADSAFTKKKHNTQPLELNSADTTALIALYRIGSSMANRIVEYREKLGGFLYLEQLKEIYGFDEDILYDLKGKVYVDVSKAHIFELNKVTVDELKTHPYFKYKLSNAIVNYRAQHGPYQALSDLKKIVIVNDSIYHNIIQYLRLN